MRNFILPICLLFATISFAQVDKEQLSLAVSKADAANTELLKAFLWKRYSTATVDGAVKATATFDFSFDEAGKVVATPVAAESTSKDQRGLRGRVQENAAEESQDYVEKALNLALAYTFMSKGELLDFFEKATLTEKAGAYELTGSSVFVSGDKLTVLIDAKTNLFLGKQFSSFVDKEAISGELKYETFSSGVSHCSTTVLNLPAKKAVISATNKDYSKRVE